MSCYYGSDGKMKEKKVKVVVNLPESMKKSVKEKAESMGLTATAWIRLVLMDKLKEEK